MGVYRAAVLAAMLLVVGTAWAQQIEAPSLRFIIVSDDGGRASANQRAVADAMAKEAERINAQFVVTAGDNFHEDGIPSAADPRWKTEFEEVYSSPALQIPWYPSLGNHDYRGSVDGEIEYSGRSARWKFDSRYYTQTERIDDSTSVLIVHLDTSPFIQKYWTESSLYHMEGQDSKKQLRWLDSVLTASRACWTIVVGHHAIYFAEPGKGDSKEMIEQVLPILKNHHVPLYVSGHYHFMQHLRHDAMDFIVCGGGADTGDVAQREDIAFGVRSLGFLSAIVTATDLRLSMIDSNSKVLYSLTIQSAASR
jgi:acid phosphatase